MITETFDSVKMPKEKTKKGPQIIKYNIPIENPSPLSRKQKALRYILCNEFVPHHRQRANPKRIATHLNVSREEAETVVEELANLGFVQIGRMQNCYGQLCRGTNPLTITPGKRSDAQDFIDLKIKEEKTEKPNSDESDDSREKLEL